MLERRNRGTADIVWRVRTIRGIQANQNMEDIDEKRLKTPFVQNRMLEPWDASQQHSGMCCMHLMLQIPVTITDDTNSCHQQIH